MEITIFAGKGGVGKSTLAAAYALSKSETQKTLLLDYDGGHSLSRVLALSQQFSSNEECKTDIKNLSLAVVDDISFMPISKAQAEDVKIGRYLAQFPGDFGLVPFCDMAMEFFGLPTDIPTVAKFASLTKLYFEAYYIKQFVIDVEPTAGLKRLLNNTETIGRSLYNLSKIGYLKLMALNATWPDIGAFLEGEYMLDVDYYMDRAKKITEALRQAKYMLVSVPESGPVAQMREIENLVVSFGGEIAGYVINNVRNEPDEARQIEEVFSRATGKKVLLIEHDRALCDSDPSSRREALLKVGGML